MTLIIWLGGTAGEPTLKITEETDMPHTTSVPALTPVSKRIIIRHMGNHWNVYLDNTAVCTFADTDFAMRLMMLTVKEIAACAGEPQMDIEASHEKIARLKWIATAKRELILTVTK